MEDESISCSLLMDNFYELLTNQSENQEVAYFYQKVAQKEHILNIDILLYELSQYEYWSERVDKTETSAKMLLNIVENEKKYTQHSYLQRTLSSKNPIQKCLKI